MISQTQIDELSGLSPWKEVPNRAALDNFWAQVQEDLNKPKESVRTSILNEAEKIVNGQRANTYGGPEDSFRTIADLWNAYFNQSSKGIPHIKAPDVAIMLALLKIARLRHNPEHRDSWVDLAGYAACGAECGIKESK